MPDQPVERTGLPEELIRFEHENRQRTLSVMLWVTMVATLALGINNLVARAWAESITLFALSAFCLLGVWYIRRGNFWLTASLYSVIVLVVIVLNLIEGNGLQDPAVVAFPILIMLGTLFFGKRSALVFMGAGVVSLAWVAVLELSGKVQPQPQPDTIISLISIVILLATAALLVWVVSDNQERSLRRIQKSESELREAYEQTLAGWAKVLEFRDKETGGHSQRVSRLAVSLARALGCSEEELTTIRRGALLHDIGKLAIPETILFKPGPLNESERQVIEQHPDFGRLMLCDIPFLTDAVSIPYCHHERWDGRGYPRGLKGEEIPLPARIFAIVDQWEALSSDRPYRHAWPREDILGYLQQNSGIIFDPRIVEAFMRIL